MIAITIINSTSVNPFRVERAFMAAMGQWVEVGKRQPKIGCRLAVAGQEQDAVRFILRLLVSAVGGLRFNR
jgi:hypothetical protein